MMPTSMNDGGQPKNGTGLTFFDAVVAELMMQTGMLNEISKLLAELLVLQQAAHPPCTVCKGTGHALEGDGYVRCTNCRGGGRL